ncbi:hypothetical protein EV421DRAFT_1739812 [Armillaria borealis]|uniref:Uncharacterized protein n=1 Tax=Armillaria borealis TaxID=47425 RepID=A0AA39J6I3_9AGAR|nr:hypothetical protein EV421DRAFT_1739812 [Armillaria borealis]
MKGTYAGPLYVILAARCFSSSKQNELRPPTNYPVLQKSSIQTEPGIEHLCFSNSGYPVWKFITWPTTVILEFGLALVVRTRGRLLMEVLIEVGLYRGRQHRLAPRRSKGDPTEPSNARGMCASSIDTFVKKETHVYRRKNKSVETGAVDVIGLIRQPGYRPGYQSSHGIVVTILHADPTPWTIQKGTMLQPRRRRPNKDAYILTENKHSPSSVVRTSIDRQTSPPPPKLHWDPEPFQSRASSGTRRVFWLYKNIRLFSSMKNNVTHTSRVEVKVVARRRHSSLSRSSRLAVTCTRGTSEEKERERGEVVVEQEPQLPNIDQAKHATSHAQVS